jgi:hypothetical protein
MPNDTGTVINPHTLNKDYDLISVLYHALQGAETVSKYQQDAQTEGVPEIAEFMRDVQEQYQKIAEEAKELLFKQKQV